MTPRHHVPEEILLDYASGTLAQPFAVLVASHLALCPSCRDELNMLESLAGNLLSGLDKGTCDAGLLGRTLARIDELPPSARQEAGAEKTPNGDPRLPQPLRGIISKPLQNLAWKGIGGFRQAEVPSKVEGCVSRLMRIRGGTAMPRHSHGGLELTLVFAGGFSDENGHYLRGDISAADPTIEHRPIADDGEECLCLAVSETPPRLTGPFGMFLNPFLNA